MYSPELPKPDLEALTGPLTLEAGDSDSFFGVFKGFLNRQVAAVQPSRPSLSAAGKQLDKAYRAYQAGSYRKAIGQLKTVEKQLGRFWIDSPASGWLAYCRACCHLEAGEQELASEWFNTARRGLNHPSLFLNYLGRAYSAATDAEKRSFLIAAFLMDPDRFASTVEPDDFETVKTRQAELIGERQMFGDDLEALVKAAITDHCSWERSAFERSEEARKARTQSHIMCAEDEIADLASNTEYRDYLLKWHTTPTSPSFESIGSPPKEDPDIIKTFSFLSHSETEAEILVEFERPYQKTSMRYHLKKSVPESQSEAVWCFTEVFSVFGEERFPVR